MIVTDIMKWFSFGKRTKNTPPKHLFNDAIYFEDMPNMKARGKYRKGHPEGLIVHFTAGRINEGRNTVKWGVDKGYQFFVIDGQAKLFQQFDIKEWGYHAGKSYWKGFGTSVSRYFVGVEIQNPGRLTKVDDNNFKSWFGKTYTKSDGVEYFEKEGNIQAGYYLKYTQDQIDCLKELIFELKMYSPKTFDLRYVLGHDEVAPSRKNDPGGALGMTMDDFRGQIISEYYERYPRED